MRGKFGRLINVLLIVVIGFTMLTFSGCGKGEDFEGHGKVMLSFISVSDIHIGSKQEEYSKDYYAKALKHAQEVTGNKLDAVAVAGDFTEGFMANYTTLIDMTKENAGEDVSLITSYGNHEGDGKHFIYEDVFGMSVDNVRKVNGYTFICVGAHAKNEYLEEQAKWLKKQLRKATFMNNKPVFILIHHSPVTGNLNPNASAALLPVLKEYPQAFVLSGHDHEEDETLWQEDFISYQNSYMKSEVRGKYSIIRFTSKKKFVIQKYTVTKDTEPQHRADEDIVIDFKAFLKDK